MTDVARGARAGAGAGAGAHADPRPTGGAPSRPRPSSHGGLRVVANHQRRRLRSARRTVFVALVIAVAAPLAVVAAYADLTSGQVRLTQLQQRLTAEQQQQTSLELRIARLEDPSTITAEARSQGMVPAGSVTDIPEVPLGAGSAKRGKISASSSGSATTGSRGGGSTGSAALGPGSTASTVGNQ